MGSDLGKSTVVTGRAFNSYLLLINSGIADYTQEIIMRRIINAKNVVAEGLERSSLVL